MKKRMKKSGKSRSKRFTRFQIIGIVLAITVLAAGAVAAVSVRTAKEKRAQAEKIKPTAANEANGKYITVKVAGQEVQMPTQNGTIRPLTPEEARKLAEGLKPMLNQSTEGLKQVQHPDGSVSMDLEGRFQNVTLAQKNSDGSLSQACVDNTDAAASFLGIDPAEFGSSAKAGSTTRSSKSGAQVNRRTTAKGDIQ